MARAVAHRATPATSGPPVRLAADLAGVVAFAVVVVDDLVAVSSSGGTASAVSGPALGSPARFPRLCARVRSCLPMASCQPS